MQGDTMSGSILGTRVKRIEDPKMLTAGGSYINDLRLEDSLYVTYVRSTMAHARLRRSTSRMPDRPMVSSPSTRSPISACRRRRR